ncbi:MAG: hypothetical protein ACI9BW_000078 [Gammaproteobacteria bacterium]|jgi:hypothetical protein
MAAISRARAVAFGIMGFALSVGIMEACLRLIEYTPAWRVLPIVERELGWPDPNVGYALRSNHRIINVRENRARPTTNSFGMRDMQRSLGKSPGTYRVLLTGDSFTEALQVEDSQTFSQIAENRLNTTQPKTPVEVFNLGMSGAGPVQQFVVAKEALQRFSADALVMLININQFRSKEMSDDSINPAYVVHGNGDLKLGYGFRERASQRYRNTWLGRTFFFLMDHSRIARAAYLRIVQRGHINSPRVGSTRDPDVLNCAPITARLNKITTRWLRDGPLSVRRLSTQLFSDVALLSKGTGVKTAIVLYGIGEPFLQCKRAMSVRQALVAQLEESLAPFEIDLWDADFEIAQFRSGALSDRSLRGFGRQRGVGHLNLTGHEHFAALMVDIVTDLRAPSVVNKGSTID